MAFLRNSHSTIRLVFLEDSSKKRSFSQEWKKFMRVHLELIKVRINLLNAKNTAYTKALHMAMFLPYLRLLLIDTVYLMLP